ncbi:SH3 domain-binding protein 5-like [Chelonia mydas]|uniref:SH3 domain-binding protein 5-like n=1 Tax=Chelonia mydas TaxID=8469 RepID=UPI001CA7C7FE|nr:SH3 domain-binding protein 5-like [Chelonia mydas]
MALLCERAVSMHKATCEKVFVVEQAVMADKNRLDPTWQETLNHATCKGHQNEICSDSGEASGDHTQDTSNPGLLSVGGKSFGSWKIHSAGSCHASVQGH